MSIHRDPNNRNAPAVKIQRVTIEKANKHPTPVKKKSTEQTGKSAVRSSRIAPLVAEPGTPQSPGISPRPANNDPSLLTKVLRIVALLTVIGITVFIYSIRDRVQEFAAFGYPGIFLTASGKCDRASACAGCGCYLCHGCDLQSTRCRARRG